LLSRLVKAIPCKRVVPHKDAARIEALCELLETDARKTMPQSTPAVTLGQS